MLSPSFGLGTVPGAGETRLHVAPHPTTHGAGPEPHPETRGAGPRPAWIVVDPAIPPLRVAALPVLDRLIVGLHRAGCSPITVCSRSPLPALPRSRAWRIPFETVADLPRRECAGVLVQADTLVDIPDLRRLATAEQPVCLVDAGGSRLPAGYAGPGSEDPETALRELPMWNASPVATRVRDAAAAAHATRALWASITSGSDGWVDRRFNRPVGRPLSRLLVHTPVSPNAVSVTSILVGVAAALGFALGTPSADIGAAILFQVSAIIDCVDGDIARAVFKESALGKWLDLAGDQVVHISVFLGIAAGLVRQGHGLEVAWLGASAAAGAALSFAVVVRGLRLLRRRGAETGRLQRILDAVTNRDFSVLVLVLALAGRLEWFIWLAGLGSHVFWLGLLVLQSRIPVGAGEER